MASLVFLPFIFTFCFIFFRYVKKTFKMADEKEGELQTVLQESLSGIRVIRAFGRGAFELELFEKKNDEFRGISYQLLHRLAQYWSISDLLCHVQALIVLIYGVYLTYTGQLTVGEFILFNSYVNIMVWPARQLGRVLSDTGRAQVAIGRIYEVLETPIETDTPHATNHELKGEIVFDDVSFSYDKDVPVLKNLSFKVAQGETIAILGSTGSGKSTLMHILLRL
jgi:ATP-binding cassette subfamily B protein